MTLAYYFLFLSQVEFPWWYSTDATGICIWRQLEELLERIRCGFFYTITTMAKPEFEDVARLLMAGAIERQPAFWPRRSMWTMASMARAPADASQLCHWCCRPRRFMWTIASITRAAAVVTPLCYWYCWCGVTTRMRRSCVVDVVDLDDLCGQWRQ